DHVRAVGQPVELTQWGEVRQLPPALSQAAYRIVQEALTNARRHGSGPTMLEVHWERTGLGLRVLNPAAAGGEPLVGHGLVGISQRAEMFGGTARAGHVGGDWEVRVHLPVPGRVVS